jgi:hypothetical protein
VWADQRSDPRLPIAVEPDEPPRCRDYWLNVELHPGDPDKVREPRPYDPAVVTKRQAARLDRERRYRTPLFERSSAERIWLAFRKEPLADAAKLEESPPRPKRPRLEKGHWPLAREAAFKWLEEEGAPVELGDKAKLEKHIAQHLSDRWNRHPVKSTIQTHVTRWIAEFRQTDQAQATEK